MSEKATQISSSISEQGEPWIKKISWKYLPLLLIPLCYIYPKPLIILMRPILKPFIGTYRRENQLQPLPEMIILNDHPELSPAILKKQVKISPRIQSDPFIIDLINLPEKEKPLKNHTTCLWAEVITNKLHYLGRINKVVLIKADQEVLQGVETQLYGMKLQESYKMGGYGKNLHVFVRNDSKGTYEREVIQWQR